MSAGAAAGVALALASAALLNWGYFAQQGVAAALPPLALKRPARSLRSLFQSRRWLVGFLVGGGGWALYIASLRVASLSLVQAASAAGIGVLALLVVRLGRVRLSRAEWRGIAAALAGLVLLAFSLAGQPARSGPGSVPAVIAWVAASLAVAGAAATTGRQAVAPGVALGVAAGVLYAAGDVATKGALGGGHRLALAPIVLLCHGLAFVALQLGFQRGGALETAGLATLWTNALPIVAGMTIFGDRLPGGAPGAARVAAFVLVVVGAAFIVGAQTAPGKRIQIE